MRETSDEGSEDAIEVNESESTLLVNSTSVKNINPGHVRKLMSTPAKGKPSPTIYQRDTFKSTVNINGNTYREVGRCIVY